MAAAPRQQKQKTMDNQLEDELHDTFFHDPKFVERFLSAADDKLQAVEEHCRANDHYYNDTHQWSVPERVADEAQLYRPIATILNNIKKAVDEVHGSPLNLVPPSRDEHPEPELFVDNHARAINSDLASTSSIKPDLVLFQDDHRHWENVRIPIEFKRLPGHHKAGMKQLSRYARAVFAHQLHRRHLYGMMVCGREATFVRLDRAGILYSGRIDMVKQSELFTRAFASLMMLDRVDEGLDPAFTFERNQKGRLVYYIDLPESKLVRPSAGSASDKNSDLMSTRSERMRRFKVVERLCHRQGICGRATIVLRIQEVIASEQKSSNEHTPREYALKLIWRDPQRDSEGDVLERVRGLFGLAQHAGHWDVSIPGKCRCPTPVKDRCMKAECVDKTVEVDGLEVCDKLRDISILVPDEENQEQELRQEFDQMKWTERQEKGSEPQVGALLESEKMLREVLEGLGHRSPTGMLSDFHLHARHSSPSNCADLAEPTFTSGATTHSTRPRDEDPTSDANGVKRRKSNSKRIVPVQQEDNPRLEQERENRKHKAIDYRTGTPAFMLVKVLDVPAGRPYHHSFLDDLESFFWLIYWSAAAHLDRGQDCPTPDAREVLDSMNHHSLLLMWGWKTEQLSKSRCDDRLAETLDSFGNEWASNSMFQRVIPELATFFDAAIASKVRRKLESSSGSTILTVVKILQDALQSEE